MLNALRVFAHEPISEHKHLSKSVWIHFDNVFMSITYLKIYDNDRKFDCIHNVLSYSSTTMILFCMKWLWLYDMVFRLILLTYLFIKAYHRITSKMISLQWYAMIDLLRSILIFCHKVHHGWLSKGKIRQSEWHSNSCLVLTLAHVPGVAVAGQGHL